MTSNDVPSTAGDTMRSASRGLMIGLLTAFTLLILVPVIFVLDPADALQSRLALSWVTLIWAVYRLIANTISRQAALMDYSFYVFVLTFFAVVPILQLGAGEFPLLSSYTYSDDVVFETQLRVLLGMGFYELGRWVCRRGRTSWLTGSAHSDISPKRTRCLGLSALAITVLGVAVYGLAPFFDSRDALAVAIYGAPNDGYRVYESSNRGLGSLIVAGLTVPAFVALAYLLASGRWRHRRGLALLLVLSNLVVNNPISNARYWTAIVLAGVGGALLDLRSPQRRRLAGLALLLVTLFSFTHLDAFRRVGGAQFASEGIADLMLSSPDYAMFQQELNATAYIARSGFSDGEQVLGAIGVYVPRALWTSKPPDTGDVVGADAGFNVSSSLWTEFYVDFGYVGLALGFMALGWTYQRLDQWLESGRVRMTGVVVAIAAAYSLVFLRGSLQPILGAGVPLFVALLWAQRRVESGSRSERQVLRKAAFK